MMHVYNTCTCMCIFTCTCMYMYIACFSFPQVQLNSKLLNTDLIEYIAYKHDSEVQTTTLPRALANPRDTDSDCSSTIASDSDDDTQIDAMMRVGPVSAVKDMGMDQAELQPSLWFVDLEEKATDSQVAASYTSRVLAL